MNVRCLIILKEIAVDQPMLLASKTSLQILSIEFFKGEYLKNGNALSSLVLSKYTFAKAVFAVSFVTNGALRVIKLLNCFQPPNQCSH